jgi:hypothetical protein
VSPPHAPRAFHLRAASIAARLVRARALRAWVALCALALLCTSAAVARVDGPGNEYQVKAAFLFNFTKYVKWPECAFENERSPIVVAVVGTDPFGRLLDDALHDKTVGSRKFEVRRFKSSDDLQACHVLFVAPSEVPRLAKICEHYAGSNTLLVGETDHFAGRGGAIGFYIEDKKVRFEINTDAIKRASLELSSQLLKLARIVKDEKDEH